MTEWALLDRILYLASWVFLIGILMVVSTAIPAVQRRFPRILLAGFLVSLASFLIVGVAAVVLG